MKKDWYKSALCKVHLDMHCPEWDKSIFENFDAAKIVDQVLRVGADALYFFAKDSYGNAYYRTATGHMHDCMSNRDFLNEILGHARKYNLPIMAYYSAIWDNFAASKYPQWCMRGPNGKPLMDTVTTDTGKWKYVCHNSPYADYAVEMIREIASGYPVSGFHLDMFNLDFGGLSCYCDNCKKLFKQETGKELPVTALWDRTWREFLEFRYRSVERLAQRFRDTALSCNPELCVVMNYHGSPDFDWRVGQKPVRHSLYSDLGTGETYTPLLGDMYPGMESRFVRNLVPGKAYEMVSWRMNRITDFTVKPLNQLRWELFTSAANGGSVMLIDQPFYDGSLDPAAYKRIGEVFKEIKDASPHFKGEFVKHVGIYYSCRNRDFYGRDEQDRFLTPVMGAYKAAAESHFNIDFIFDETVNSELLSRYPVIILPNVAAMSSHEADMFRKYVLHGGILLSSFDTSLHSEDGDKLKEFQLADVFGVSFTEYYDCDNNYIRGLEESFGDGIDEQYHILNQGGVNLVKTVSATGYGSLHDAFFKRVFPDRFFSHNIHPPYNRLQHAVYVNHFGKGVSVYMPNQCDRSYADRYELPEHRMIIRNIISSLCPSELVRINAPLNVETLIRKTADRIYIHFTAFNPIRQAVTLPSLNKPIRPSIRMEEPAIYQASVEVRMPFKSVSTLDNATKIDIEGNVITILCNKVYELLIIETSQSVDGV